MNALTGLLFLAACGYRNRKEQRAGKLNVLEITIQTQSQTPYQSVRQHFSPNYSLIFNSFPQYRHPQENDPGPRGAEREFYFRLHRGKRSAGGWRLFER